MASVSPFDVTSRDRSDFSCGRVSADDPRSDLLYRVLRTVTLVAPTGSCDADHGDASDLPSGPEV